MSPIVKVICLIQLYVTSSSSRLLSFCQEPTHLRNRELLVLRAQLQQKVAELQRELETKNSRGILTTSPPRVSSPVNVWTLSSTWPQLFTDPFSLWAGTTWHVDCSLKKVFVTLVKHSLMKPAEGKWSKLLSQCVISGWQLDRHMKCFDFPHFYTFLGNMCHGRRFNIP